MQAFQNESDLIPVSVVSEVFVYRSGLEIILNSYFPKCTVNSYSFIEELTASVVLSQKPKVVILISTGTFSRLLSQISNLRLRDKEVNILICCSSASVVYINRIAKAGVCGFICLEDDLMDIRKGFEAILEGKYFVSDNLSQALYHNLLISKFNNPFETLSNFEFQIAEEIHLHSKFTAVAKVLDLSPSTISRCKNRILKKLNLKPNDIRGFRSLIDQYSPFTNNITDQSV